MTDGILRGLADTSGRRQMKTAAAQRIVPCLWFGGNAEEAVGLYTSAFKGSKAIKTVRYEKHSAKASGMAEGSVLTVLFELSGYRMLALNGSPDFPFTHAFSFFVSCETEREIDRLYAKLSDGGKILMPYQEYPFSRKYCWLEDRYGLSWQLSLAGEKLRITPCLMFDGDALGKAEEAMRFYSSLFGKSGIKSLVRYGPENKAAEGMVVHGEFLLAGQDFMAMDNGRPSGVVFNESVSLMVHCRDQEGIDHFWEKLSAHPDAEQCGWLRDRYGVSWQIVPEKLDELLARGEAMKAMIAMKKLDIGKLETAGKK